MCVVENAPTLFDRNWKEAEENLKDAFKYRPLLQFVNFFSFSFPKGDVVDDVPTLSVRIVENQQIIWKTFSNVVLSRFVQFSNFFSFSFPKGDVVKDVLTLSARIEENQKRIVKTFSNVVLFRCAQFLNFFSFSSPKGDVVEDVPTLSARGCTLQINEPQLQRFKHQHATHQRLSTSTMSGWSSEHTGCTKSSVDQQLFTSMKKIFGTKVT